MGRLTTHVLDTAIGRPAAGISVQLFRLGASREHLRSAVTNADGRCDAPLAEGEQLTAGAYELEFHAGDYLADRAQENGQFLDVIVIRFQVSEPDQHYHVPLLLSPYGYTTYRGS
jgi:5-hydroxyisourate hydrolase